MKASDPPQGSGRPLWAENVPDVPKRTLPRFLSPEIASTLCGHCRDVLEGTAEIVARHDLDHRIVTNTAAEYARQCGRCLGKPETRGLARDREDI